MRRLRELLAQQCQLLRDLSHELRTPLARLRVATESDLPPEELRGRVEREIATMQSLVDDTLELAWLDSEQPRLECAPVDVAALWDVVAEDARFESGWPRHRLRAELPEACRVHAHLNTLARAIENVVRNAIRHSPPDGEVRLHARRDGAHWLLGIDDDGPGVAEDALQTIFRPFTRLAAARPGGDGFGLGLSIARHVVALQHGEMWAENRPGGGLCVWFRLPAA